MNALYEEAKKLMNKSIDHLDTELRKLRVGKASPQMVESIQVDYYGSMTSISQVANISTPDSKTISIQPWEKSLIAAIEKAIIASNMGLNPQNDGALIRLFIPPLTEERRKELVKRSQAEGEHAKVGIRNVRRDIMEKLKKNEKSDNLSEDVVKEATAEIQKITDNYIERIDKIVAQKDKDIMTV